MTEPVSAPPPKKPRPLKKLESLCVDVVRNTPDTVTLLLDPGAQPEYDAGQFISIDPRQFPELSRQMLFLEHLKGKREQHRAYSMSSSPSERYVSVTVKAEGFDPKHDKYPPLLSPFLASEAMKGRTVNFVGYTGAYTLDPDHSQRTSQVLHLVAGSGIVPNYALLKDELLNHKSPTVKHTMVYVNKTASDVIFAAELQTLATQFPERFELWHCLTREQPPAAAPVPGARWRHGRPTLEWVRSLVQDPTTLLVFACGAAITKHHRLAAEETGVPATPRFMEGIEEIVHAMGIEKPRYKSEEFG